MKLQINADYHTHTIYSDGKGSVEDNIKQAISLGLEKIAITDHGLNHQYFGGIYKKQMNKIDILKKQKEEIENLKEKYKNIQILFGIEANLISCNGDVDLTDEQCKLFDIIILGTHYSPFANNFSKTLHWKYRNYFFNTKKHSKIATTAYLKAMDNYPINILAHLNHIVKVDIEKIAKKAKENNVLIELNEKNLHFSEKEWEILIASGVKLVINSDAHKPEDIASFKNVEKFLQNKNIPDNRILNLKNIN